MSEVSEQEQAYKPRPRFRVCLTGALRNAADTLEAYYRARHGKLPSETGDDDEDGEDDLGDLDFNKNLDYAAAEAYVLREIANNIEILDKDPSELFDFADLYALYGLAGAHFKPEGTPPATDDDAQDSAAA